ncbi:MAG: hypothetical protein ACJAQ1_001180 [Flavobacterium sp.]
MYFLFSKILKKKFINLFWAFPQKSGRAFR